MSPSSLRTRSVALLVALLVLFSTAPGLVAADARAGGDVVVREGHTVSEDLQVFAGSATIRGTVDGDLDVFAGDVYLADTARVTGDVHVFGGSVRLAGAVDGEVVTAAGNVDLTETGVVGESLVASGGTVAVAGTVRGDATLAAESVTLADTAVVEGDVTYDAGSFSDEGAAVGGSVTHDEGLTVGPPVVEDPVGTFFPGWVLGVYGFLVNLLLGAILLVVAPAFSRRVADTALDGPVRAGGYGLLTLVVVPVVLVLVALTIVGIPLTLVGALLFALVAWVGAIYGRLAVGTWLTAAADVENRWAALVVGLFVVAVAVRVPVLGGLVELLVFLLGLGALVLVGRDVRRQRRATVDGTGGPDAADAPPA